MLPAGTSRLLDPIHGRGVFQCSNISSNLKVSTHRMVAAGGIIFQIKGGSSVVVFFVYLRSF